MRRTIALLTALGLMMPLAAHALNEKVWLTVNGGGGKYDMSELNAEITAFNAANAGSGMAFPLVEDGVSWGGAVGYETPGHWNFGLGLDRLHAATKAGDTNGSLDYQLTANAWHAFADYALQPMGHSSLFLGAGVGILAESGKIIEATPGELPLEYRLHGSSPLCEAHGGGSWWATPRFALVATAGYRYAKLKSLKVEGGAFINAYGEDLAVDYSGPYFRVGFKLAGNADQ